MRKSSTTCERCTRVPNMKSRMPKRQESSDGMTLKYSQVGGNRSGRVLMEKVNIDSVFLLAILLLLSGSSELIITVNAANAASPLSSLSPSPSHPQNPQNPQNKISLETTESSGEILIRDLRSASGINGLSKYNSDFQYNRLSRALERIHFGPLLRLRSPISSRSGPYKQLASYENLAPRSKKALSFFSRFYPVLQSGSSSYSAASEVMASGGGYGSRRRVSFPHSHSSSESFNMGRFSRPIMRLRWGK